VRGGVGWPAYNSLQVGSWLYVRAQSSTTATSNHDGVSTGSSSKANDTVK
jgi:hypothetical protein